MFLIRNPVLRMLALQGLEMVSADNHLVRTDNTMERVMKLYCMPGACSLASHIVCEWTGTPVDIELLSHEELKQDAYLKINPSGAVPALDTGHGVLTQNAAVLNFLADTHPDSKLTGDGSALGRAEVNRWFGMLNADMHPAFKPLFGTTDFLANADAIAKSKENAKAVVQIWFERINQQLEGRDWLADTRSIVDPYLFVMTRWAKSMAFDLEGLANIEAHFQRMQSDPGVQRVLKAEGLS